MYNLAAISFTPAEIAAEVERLSPGFEMSYAPDFRQVRQRPSVGVQHPSPLFFNISGCAPSPPPPSFASTQDIADSWPRTLDDSDARRDWGWRHEYDLASMSKDMMKALKSKLRNQKL